MRKRKEKELKALQQQIIMVHVMEAPGAVLAGLGLYGVFGANGDAFIDLLNNQTIAYGAIAVGVIIMVGSVFRLLPLLRRRVELANELKALEE